METAKHKINWGGLIALGIQAGCALGAYALGAEDIAYLFAGAAVGGAVMPTLVSRK